MQREPPPFVWAVPDEKNILTWNFIIRGPPDSPYVGGEYHGVLLFPSEYPFKPPGIKMYTPSGRFQPDKKICFSMSDFHPGTWNPAWSVATILTGLLSFMLADEITTGSVTTTDSDKRAYAARSHAWNIAQRKFKEAFPDFCAPELRDLPNMGEKERGKPDPKPTQLQSSCSSTPNTPATATPANPIATPCPLAAMSSSGAAAIGTHHPAGEVAKAAGTGTGTGWAMAWRQLILEKWRWGLLIALAVVLSRVSS